MAAFHACTSFDIFRQFAGRCAFLLTGRSGLPILNMRTCAPFAIHTVWCVSDERPAILVLPWLATASSTCMTRHECVCKTEVCVLLRRRWPEGTVNFRDVKTKWLQAGLQVW